MLNTRKMLLPNRQAVSVAILLLTSALVGCSSKSPLARVQGKVLLDGKPLATGSIVTLPEDGRGARGTITNGQFELSTLGNNDGALIGTHKVSVSAHESP